MKNAGYSLLESLVVLSLIGILSISAVVGIHGESERSRVSQGLQEMFALTSLARQLAITRNQAVEIERNGQQWRIAGVAVAQTNYARFRGFRPPPIVFYPNGSSSNGTWTLCAPPYAQPRGLVLSRNGRARTTQDRDEDGVDESASGQPLVC